MILESNKNEVITVGDVKENAVRIDSHNIEHIVALLSTNLYSHPEESFLRETISNAIDSTIEAGSNEPVILKFSKCTSDNNLYTVTIRDYGTGISPERFEEIYLSIGASTKRESNEYLGCFGIGRFSCLACSNAATIKSYYNGIEYCYLMIRNGSKINIDLLYQNATEEPNGVEISINIDTLWNFKNAISSLIYFPNLYIDTSSLNYNVHDTFINEVNELKDTPIAKYDTFYIGATTTRNHWSYSYKLVVGNVLYNYDYSKLFQEYDATSEKFREVFSYINPIFNIGDLDITPNREQLLYSDKTIKALQSKAKEIVHEIEHLYYEAYSGDSTSIFEYAYKVNNCRKLLLMFYYLPVRDCGFYPAFTYNGTEWSSGFNNRLLYLLKCRPYLYHIVYNHAFCKGGKVGKNYKSPLEFIECAIETNTKINIYICKEVDLYSTNFKRYLGSFDDGIVLEKTSLKNAIKRINATIPASTYEDVCNQQNVIYEFYKYIVSIAKEINKDDIYEEWCKNNKRKRITPINAPVVSDKTYSLMVHRTYSYGVTSRTYKFTYNQLFTDDIFRWCGAYPDSNTIFYTVKDSEELKMFSTIEFSKRNVQAVSISKELYSYVEKNKIKGWINLNKIINLHTKQINKLFTYYYYTHTESFLECGHKIKNNFISYIPVEDASKIIKLFSSNYRYSVYDNGYEHIFRRWYEKFLSEGKFDAELTESYNTLMKYVKVYKKLKNLILLFGDGSIMLAWVAMKNHLLRLNYQTYSKVKSLYKLNNDECN